MKTSFIKTPTEARKFAYFTTLKNSKRVRWNERRQYGH